MAGIVRKPQADVSGGRGPGDEAYVAMLARARSLVPQLRARAAHTEELRRLPAETERDLHEAGLFRMVQPKRVGGSEFDYVALVDFAEATPSDCAPIVPRRCHESGALERVSWQRIPVE